MKTPHDAAMLPGSGQVLPSPAAPQHSKGWAAENHLLKQNRCFPTASKTKSNPGDICGGSHRGKVSHFVTLTLPQASYDSIPKNSMIL